MAEYFKYIYDFINKPIITIIFIIFFLVMGIHIILRLIKTLRSTDNIGLYSINNLWLISFSLNCAIDVYEQNYTDDEFDKIDHYKNLINLNEYVQKLMEEHYNV